MRRTAVAALRTRPATVARAAPHVLARHLGAAATAARTPGGGLHQQEAGRRPDGSQRQVNLESTRSPRSGTSAKLPALAPHAALDALERFAEDSSVFTDDLSFIALFERGDQRGKKSSQNRDQSSCPWGTK